LGLGLSVVSRLVHLLGAEVVVISREGRGTCFSLLLPLDCGIDRPPAMPDAVGFGSGRMLVIEDDASVRTGLQVLVEGWGYETVAAASGEEALVIGAEQGWRFDAILADYRLGPGLTGIATAEEIHARSGRRRPTLVVTGDTAPERIAEIHASGFEILHKPVGAEQLRRKLALMLERVGSEKLL
jgi:CheY-like chemotaxis protein